MGIEGMRWDGESLGRWGSFEKIYSNYSPIVGSGAVVGMLDIADCLETDRASSFAFWA